MPLQVLCMLFDSRKSDRPCLKSAFRVTTQKLLYGIVIAAAGTRGIYFSVQVLPCTLFVATQVV